MQADYASGLEAGVSATPTLFVDGVPYDGRLDLGALQRATGLPGGDAAQVRRRPWQRRQG